MDFKMCGLAICGIVLCVIFKNIKNEYTLFIRLGISCLILIFSFSLFLPIITYIEEISRNTIAYNYIPLLIKILGLSVVLQLTIDVSKDAGEEAIASKVALLGKAQILVLTMPLITSLFEMCKEMLR
jgi:stage III sporulation protein AD